MSLQRLTYIHTYLIETLLFGSDFSIENLNVLLELCVDQWGPVISWSIVIQFTSSLSHTHTQHTHIHKHMYTHTHTHTHVHTHTLSFHSLSSVPWLAAETSSFRLIILPITQIMKKIWTCFSYTHIHTCITLQ